MDRRMWHGALILIVAGFIIKILSAFYRLPYQNLAGDVGLYVYQQIYPFYALAVIMAATGFPMVLSKIFAEHEVAYGYNNHKGLLYTAFVTLSGLSLFLFLSLFLSAQALSNFMKDSALVYPLRMISVTFIFVPVLATLRGYFQGSFYNMNPTALSQVIEQTLRVTIILGLSFWLFNHHANPYAFGRAAALGSTLGPLGSAIILLVFFIKSPFLQSLSKQNGYFFDTRVSKRLINEGLAFSISALSLVSLQFIDSLTLVPMMNLAGHSLDMAKEAKGIFDRSYPLIQMGMTIAVSVGTALVPILARSFRSRDQEKLNNQMTLSLRISIIFGAAACAGLVMIIRETNMMLFTNDDGTSAIRWMAVCILFMSIALTSSTILQSMGYLWTPVIHVGAAFLIKLLLNVLLIQAEGLEGAAQASVAATVALAGLNLNILRRRYKIKVFQIEQWIQFIFVIFLMMGSVWLWKEGIKTIFLYGMAMERGSASLMALSSVVIGAVIFLLALFSSKLLTEDEIEQMPFGDKLYGVFRKMVGKEFRS